jgi:hypothetical protein
VIASFPHVRLLEQRVQDADLALVRQLQAGAWLERKWGGGGMGCAMTSG